MDTRLERMEDMLSQLIKMVGNMKVENDKNHDEVIDKLKNIEIDQDYIWEKAVRNERDIAKIIKQRN